MMLLWSHQVLDQQQMNVAILDQYVEFSLF